MSASTEGLRDLADVRCALRAERSLPLAVVSFLQEARDVGVTGCAQDVDHVIGVVHRDAELFAILLRQVRQDERRVRFEGGPVEHPSYRFDERERRGLVEPLRDRRNVHAPLDQE